MISYLLFLMNMMQWFKLSIKKNQFFGSSFDSFGSFLRLTLFWILDLGSFLAMKCVLPGAVI